MAEERIQRRLAAIMVADVAGYSRLMGVDEEGTLRALNAHLDELIKPTLAKHSGRLVKTTGDGFLAEFASVVEAVRCAVSIQEGMRERNAPAAYGQRVDFRIGVNLGDVIVQDTDVFGDGVNVAARLEGLAAPGGVVISGSVHEQVDAKLDLTYSDLGPQRVKNIAHPVRAFAILGAGDPERTAPPQRPAAPDRPSIVVVPFDNPSNDPEQAYFSDGMTEDIITELSKISGLFVIARRTALTYKDRPVTLRQIGQDLGVRYALEGSVRRADRHLRITTRLVDTETDLHLWAERYDRDVADLFAVQAEVARSVAEALAVSLKPHEDTRIVRQPTENIAAYDLYLRTRGSPFPPTRENILNARSAYAQVVEIDPAFVGGHSGIALTHAMAVVFGASAAPQADVSAAIAAAQRALSIDEGFAQAHSALGLAYLASGQHDEAIAATRRATELQPGDPDAQSCLGIALAFAGDGDGACAAAERALRLDPQYTSGPYLNLLGAGNFIAGRYAASIDAFKRNVARGGPVGPPMLHIWAAAYAADGQAEKARETADKLLQFFPGFSASGFPMLRMYKNESDRQRLIACMKQAGLPD